MIQSQKDRIYDLINENRFSIFNNKNKEKNFLKFLNDNNIILPINEYSLMKVISFLKNVNIKCGIEGCENNRVFEGIRNNNRTEFGFKKFCSSQCEHRGRSIRQSGKNNTCHRMTEESFKSMCIKNSIIMKDKIKNGEFTPNITNSWNYGTSYLIKNGLKIKYRSSWEAFFHLCNENLEYEKVRIEYEYKNELHYYIVDFIDTIDKKLYEIKPISQISNPIVKIKEEYCLKWCVENGYEFIFITEDWYINNLGKSKNLLNDQPDGENIYKKLKKFDEN
jgi:hypothetical protein